MSLDELKARTPAQLDTLLVLFFSGFSDLWGLWGPERCDSVRAGIVYICLYIPLLGRAVKVPHSTSVRVRACICIYIYLYVYIAFFFFKSLHIFIHVNTMLRISMTHFEHNTS